MTKAMTPIQTIEHLETLLSAATEGPWIVSGGRQSSLTLGRDVQLHTIGPDGDGVADELETKHAGFYGEPQTVEAKSFLGAWARARRLWCDCTGEDLI